MATLTGTKPKNTYKDLLQVSNSNSGVDGTLRDVEDGEGTVSALQISSAAVKSTGTLEVTGATTLTGAVTMAATLGVGETSPLGKLHVKTADAGTITPSTNADELVLEGSGNSGLTIYSSTTGSGNVFFGDSGDDDIGGVTYNHSNNRMSFLVNASNVFTFVEGTPDAIIPTTDQGGNLGITATNRFTDAFLINSVTTESGSGTKENITESDLGLDFVKALRPVRFKRRGRARDHYGFLAEEVRDAAVKDFAGFTDAAINDPSLADNPARYGLRLEEFIGPLVKSVQELTDRVEALEAA